jgi:synaptobrevin family protein YKT6
LSSFSLLAKVFSCSCQPSASFFSTFRTSSFSDLEIFSAKYSKETWMSCTVPIETPWLKELFRLHKNPAEADSLTRVQQELDETKIVLHKTIESLLERGEKLDDMVSKSNELGILSKEFLKGSRKTNSCCIIQ